MFKNNQSFVWIRFDSLGYLTRFFVFLSEVFVLQVTWGSVVAQGPELLVTLSMSRKVPCAVAFGFRKMSKRGDISSLPYGYLWFPKKP